MELLLNLLWLMLALPAILILRRQPAYGGNSGSIYSPRAFVLLGCILVLLFPIVSATDDLHPIRAEIEESSPSKRIVKQSPGAKSQAWRSDGSPPAQLIYVSSFAPDNDRRGLVSEYLLFPPEQAPAGTIGCRAPPAR
jgi:hypothetical protein